MKLSSFFRLLIPVFLLGNFFFNSSTLILLICVFLRFIPLLSQRFALIF